MRNPTCKTLVLFLFVLPIHFVFAQETLININTATLTELEDLPGVGPATAQSIIDNRPYETIQEISRADGIGEPGSASYENIIGLITVGTSPEEEAGAEITSTSTDSNSGSSGSGRPKKPELLTISIGSDFTGSAGSPLEFEVETNFTGARSRDIKWNFGDGSEDYGREVTHVYEYAGNYVVVADLDGVSARINAEIIQPELSVTYADSKRIEITNSSGDEISLFGRALLSGKSAFIFPENSFLQAGEKISFSSNVTKLKPRYRLDVFIITIGNAESTKVVQKIESERAEKEKEVQEKLSALQGQLEAIYARQNAGPQKAPQPAPLVSLENNEGADAEEIALTASAIQATKEEDEGWWQLIKNFFLRNK